MLLTNEVSQCVIPSSERKENKPFLSALNIFGSLPKQTKRQFYDRLDS